MVPYYPITYNNYRLSFYQVKRNVFTSNKKVSYETGIAEYTAEPLL